MPMANACFEGYAEELKAWLTQRLLTRCGPRGKALLLLVVHCEEGGHFVEELLKSRGPFQERMIVSR